VPGQHRSESGTSWKSSKMMGVGHQKLGLNWKKWGFLLGYSGM
jgi:hypothetical protein